MSIQVNIRNIYGEERIYPACEKSKLFTQLINQKTLTRRDIATIKALGYTIEVVQPTETL